ncbi:MAG TPA: EAL domain-containing protein [Baekduia sp.]|nr:EAL domain-containing protein [Baekduia sp.]
METLNSLTTEVALLDERGVVLLTNRSWERFAAENGGGQTVGASYLDVCAQAGDDPIAREVGHGIGEILHGTREQLEVEYPCHGPAAERWFLVRAARHRGPGPARVVVQHEDVTARRVAEEEEARIRARLLDAVAGERLTREPSSLSSIRRIRDALDRDRLVLHAQPIVELATGRVVRHELLIRMLDEDDRLLTPERFLPAAESHGLIAEVDRWVLRQAVALVARGHALQMNLSAESLGRPGLLDLVRAELRHTGADPSLLVVELTETALPRCAATAQTFVEGVKALGCGVALDDFGTGYGGFTYLKRYPVDALKIDVEFVRDLARDPASRHLVTAVVGLAAAFGLSCVAEGVEDAETAALLRELGVDRAQGYFFGAPGPLAETLDRHAAGAPRVGERDMRR